MLAQIFFSFIPFLLFLQIILAAPSYDLSQFEKFTESQKYQASDELNTLNHIISMTTKTLEEQQELKKQISEYFRLQKIYLESNRDNSSLNRMAKLAHVILETIKKQQLTYAFSKDFISELTLFSQVANKRGIPKLAF